MHVTRDSLLRTIAGVSAGIILGCGVTVSSLVILAEATAPGRGYAAWLRGAWVIQLGYGPAILLGAIAGSWLGRRYLLQPHRRPWPRRPRGTFLNHYPGALLGGAILGALSSFFTIPAARIVVDTVNLYAQELMPRIPRTTELLMIAVVVLGTLSVARSTVHVLDRDIYARRKMRDALEAMGG